ncbi:hypothetical protein [Herpetosiphon sp. NSE202]
MTTTTVEKHLTTIFKRLNIHNRTALSQWYWLQQTIPYQSS